MIFNSKQVIKHAPQRTCIACRKVVTKRDLIRIVLNADSDIEIDLKGKQPGRGAYLCLSLGCFEDACKGNHLEHALRHKITRETKERLITQARSLLKGA